MGYYGDTVKFVAGKPGPNNAPSGFYPSEARFLRRATEPLQFFNNAVKHLAENAEKYTADIIGIQEFHPPTYGQIMTALQKVNPNYVGEIFDTNITNNAKTLTIWDSSKLGVKESKYEADLGEGTGDAGRCITIIVTTKGYILVNFHGTKSPGELKRIIPYHVGKAVGDLNLSKLIIMCDSNDSGHSINMNKPLQLNGLDFHDGHPSDEGAVSCCYNYDSCGIFENSRLISKNPKIKFGTMGKEGAESNYKFTGDYILGTTVIKPVEAINSPQDADGASIASDHKLVHGIVEVPASGGSRKTRRRSKLKKKKATRRK